MPREDGFDITVASEIMAIFCLATSITDLKERLGRIVVGYTYDDQPVTAARPARRGRHGRAAQGRAQAQPRADARGHAGVRARRPLRQHRARLQLHHGHADGPARWATTAITEAGFGADLGAEKFLDIKCRLTGLKPDAVVVVATVRALKNHGGVAKDALNDENLQALEAGLPNLLQHVENITNVYNLPCVVAINRFPTDTEAELKLVEDKCRELGVNVALSEVWAKGGEGGLALADEVVRLCENGDEAGRSADTFQFSYGDDLSLREKIEAVAKNVYRADGVDFEAKAAEGAGDSWRSSASAACPCAWPRPSTASATTRRSWARRAVSRITVRDVKCQRRRRLRGGAHRQHHDHAGPGQEPRGLQDRRG